nr:uncharacterized protein LOC108946273 [Nicotiana tomentosiformis]
MVDNNFTESFNSWILEARQQPIVKMLETIRVRVITLLKDHGDEVSSWKDDYNPYVMVLYNDYREMSQDCTSFFNRERGYEVSQGSDRHTVILELQKCTCRIWDLFGIPCPHAIRSFNYKKLDPKTRIHWWHSK